MSYEFKFELKHSKTYFCYLEKKNENMFDDQKIKNYFMFLNTENMVLLENNF